MLNRRSFLSGLSASVPLLTLPGAGTLQAQGAPRLLAMVVGINAYTGRDANGRRIKSLEGCINDAADIEDKVRRFNPAFFRRLGWDPSRPRGQQHVPVMRATFMDTWKELLA